ncbi:uncharacterized protein [Aristolochia californica]|uniref:uncharacterized protein n=1 Tax=Aristolochia californica TaxID=171875 RepID=UPI0035DC1D9C
MANWVGGLVPTSVESRNDISELERAPTLFSIKADEQLKALAYKSQFFGGHDLWSERDETQFCHNQDWLPSARFFPKGAVHNVKPYGIIDSVGRSSYSKMSNVEEDLPKKRNRTKRPIFLFGCP